MKAAEVREGDVIRLTPGGPACRVYRNRARSKDAVERLVVDGHPMVRFATGTGPVTVPADQDVELVARHGNRRLVSLVKAWYLGPAVVGSVVTYRHAPAGAVFRVVHVNQHGRYALAPFAGGPEEHVKVRVGDLTLVRSRAVEAVRKAGAA